MATDSIMGLFQTPEQYQMAQRQAVMKQLAEEAAMDPRAKADYLAGMSGYGLGKLAGGILGTQDPALQAATMRTALAKGKDFTTASGWGDYAKALQESGDLQGAAAASQRATELQAKIDEKQAAREQALLIAREKNQSAEAIARERTAIQAQIAQMNASLRGANNDVQRQLIEQRIEDLKTKAEDKRLQLEQSTQGRVAAFDSALSTLDVIANHPGKKDVVGALSGGVLSVIPGTDAAGFASQLETFKAQTFIPQVAALKGMGALSDAEGKKLTDAVGALSVKMKPFEFNRQLSTIKADLENAKQRAMSILKRSPASQEDPLGLRK